ncbi:MAG: dienelactone hydrolase family protein [Betaproteobacteria bacterium]|jgi:carboxymethylenebutenolidase
MGKTIQVEAKDQFKNDNYVAYPKGQATACIIVLQEIFGVNAHIKAVVDGYAEQGYLAIAPATFSRIKKDVDLGYAPDDMKAGLELKTAAESLAEEGVLKDIQASVDWAIAETKGLKVGVVGYCWGGLLAWRSAANVNGLDAAAPYYGGGMTVEPAISLTPKCPTIAHFAEKDHWITMDTVKAFEEKHSNVEVFLYPADHGFNCDHRGAFHEESANIALKRTLTFFQKHLLN